MPVLSKKAKKGKGQKGSKKGAVKIVPDPDAAYKQQLDEAFYVPKPSRERINQRNISAVDAAIRASAVSAGSGAAGEPSLTSPILLARVPEIVRSLGLCATDEQMDQICCMVTQTAPAKTATGEAPPQALSPYADVERVRRVLSEMLHTHVLAYDPQVLACPDPRFPTRVSSVIYKVSERDLASCFAAIWEATGRKTITRSDGAEVRCFTVNEMEAIIAEAHLGSSAVKPLSKDELDDLYFFIKSEANDLIGEDTFLRCLGDVK